MYARQRAGGSGMRLTSLSYTVSLIFEKLAKTMSRKRREPSWSVELVRSSISSSGGGGDCGTKCTVRYNGKVTFI
jgi:hypothetical protein